MFRFIPFRRLRVILVVSVTVIFLTPLGSAASTIQQSCADASQVHQTINIVRYVQDFVSKINGPREGYDIPSEQQARDFIRGFNQAADGNIEGACTILATLGYQVLTVRDISSDKHRSLTLLREIRDKAGQPYKHGWGLFVLGDSQSNLVVEVAHPCPATSSCSLGDRRTETVGAQAFRLAQARFLFVAGAERNALDPVDPQHPNCSFRNDPNPNCPSDAAHNSTTMFARVHKATMTRGRATVYQPHGFNPAAGDRAPGCPKKTGDGCDIVVSSGDPGRRSGDLDKRSDDAARVAYALRQTKRFRVCLYPLSCDFLGATNNVEKKNMLGNIFVSVEVATSINTSEDSLVLARAAASTLR
jgi:hypothetical protein